MTYGPWCSSDPPSVGGVFSCLHRPFGFPLPVLDIAQAATPSDAFLQYGAIGAVALLALGTVRYLFQRQIQQHEQEIAYREKKEQAAEARAERAERQLAELNVLIRDRLVVELTRATDAASRAAEKLGREGIK